MSSSLRVLISASLAAALMAVGASTLQGDDTLSPGPLHVSHSNATCSDCHEPWAGVTDQKCLDCHEDVDTQGTENYSLHENMEGECKTCHDEHIGTSSNLTTSFNHDELGGCAKCHAEDLEQNFSEGEHWDTDCQDCHGTEDWKNVDFDHSATEKNCTDCHTKDLKREFSAGEHWDTDCGDCHDTKDWDNIDFDHSETEKTCTDCHAKDASIITGEHWDTDCGDCHGTENWNDAKFDHASTKKSCTDCHTDDLDEEFGSSGHIRKNCDACHGTDSWDHIVIDHGQYFPLRTEGHWGVSCKRCHPGGFDQTTCSEGWGCHSDGTLERWKEGGGRGVEEPGEEFEDDDFDDDFEDDDRWDQEFDDEWDEEEEDDFGEEGDDDGFSGSRGFEGDELEEDDD